MEELIPIASKLQDVLGALGQNTTLDLPQIVVVGGQSSGKSSVLEGIVGRSFLPRGHGIVTRRPLILQLYNTAVPPVGGEENEEDEFKDENVVNDDDDGDGSNIEEYENSVEYEEALSNTNKSSSNSKSSKQQPRTSIEMSDEWGEFLHLPGRRFHDFTAIRQEIVRDTERLTGKNKGINPTPINLKIYSPRVLALTMVDLPGMAKVAVGDQPPDIEDQIKDMSLQYISNPNAIILAVTSANTDLANSDALKLSQSVDPFGERTVGVLTKLDLMDPGTDAADMLHNRTIPLRRGYVGVVNRGQRDVDADLSIREGLRKEQHFFRTHPTYGHDRALAGKCGTINLAKILNTILMHHIKECLPELKSRISTMMGDVQLELHALGTSTEGTSRSTLGASLLALLSKFTANFSSTIDGRGNMMSPSSNNQTGPGSNLTSTDHITTEMNELFGGARISYIFNDIFSRSLMMVGAFDGLEDEEIRATICNANGTRPSLFVPEISFDILVRRQICRLEQPGIQCVDLVYEELQRIASQCEPNELTRFPKLRDRMVEVVSGLLKRAVMPTQVMVSNLVKIELSYINTSHPDFIGGSMAVAQLMQKMGKDKERENNAAGGGNDGTAGENQHLNGSSNAMNGHANVGATPISSSALNISSADDDDRLMQISSTNANHNGPSISNYNHQQMNSPGGIMSFIFGGGGNGTKTPGKTNINGIFRSPRASSSRNGGPPSIVQLPQVPDTMRQTDAPPTDREKIEMEIIKSLIESYFSIVRKNFIDMVPKTIMYFLVNHVRDAMQNELVAELYRDAEVQSLMKEAEDVAQRRRTCVEMKDLLTKALEIVNEVRDFNTFK